MKIFITGGSGFVGRQVVRRLRAQGEQVWALAASDRSAALLEAAGTHVVRGDITEPASLRRGMLGSALVFHLAGWHKLGARDWREAEALNVGGTRNVLGLAHDLGVPRIVYTSTISVFGDTRGALVNERYVGSGPALSEYERTKWIAHYKVALPLIYRKTAPIIIVMPGGVYGPGDTSILADLMRLYYRGLLPVVPAPNTTLAYAHVEDVAAGHLLAAARGAPGERYILAGPPVSLRQLIDIWAAILDRRPPALAVPAALLRPLAFVAGAVETVLPLPPLLSREALLSLGTSYIARADKAHAELGWQARPLRLGMAETLDWIAQTTNPPA